MVQLIQQWLSHQGRFKNPLFAQCPRLGVSAGLLYSVREAGCVWGLQCSGLETGCVRVLGVCWNSWESQQQGTLTSARLRARAKKHFPYLPLSCHEVWPISVWVFQPQMIQLTKYPSHGWSAAWGFSYFLTESSWSSIAILSLPHLVICTHGCVCLCHSSFQMETVTRSWLYPTW